MNKRIRSLLVLLVPLCTANAQDTTGISTVTFGLGAGRPVNPTYTTGGPQLNGSYEYRFLKHWAVEFGVDTSLVKTGNYAVIVTYPASGTILTGPSSYSYSYSKINAFATSMPFGFRGILPLSQGRLELFGGGGGAYLWNPNSNDGGWGWQASLGARLAVDKHRRYWLGTTGRYVRSNWANPSQWITWTADLGFRFGH